MEIPPQEVVERAQSMGLYKDGICHSCLSKSIRARVTLLLSQRRPATEMALPGGVWLGGSSKSIIPGTLVKLRFRHQVSALG